MISTPLLRVALAVPLRAFFDYLPIQDGTERQYHPGIRLRVPFGKSFRTAVLVDIVEHSEIEPKLLKPVSEVLDEKPVLSPADLDFLQWVSSYYHHPAGEVILSALPVRLRQGKSLASPKINYWQCASTANEDSLEGLKRAPKQQALLKLFISSSQPLSREDLTKALPDYQAALKALLQKSLVIAVEKQPHDSIRQSPLSLNNDQEKVVNSVLNSDTFAAFLLYGITGSGKTATYQAIMHEKLCQGKQVLVLVPEIGLTPQLLQRFTEILNDDFPDQQGRKMVVLHSAMADAERSLAWQQAVNGEADIILGTRSAVLTPLPRLGMIIVDEEHDQSYKQQEGFRYSARDLAVVRAKQSNCPVLLGSATPSFESYQNALKGHYQLLRMQERAAGARPPDIKLIDIRSVRLAKGFSPVTRRLMQEELDKHNQVLVFINRRGFAPVITCHDCGWVAECARCDARMTAHFSSQRLSCHHCGAQQPWPQKCPECGSEKLYTIGEGTEQIEGALKGFFPDTQCVRIDRDSTRKKGSMDKLLDSVRQGHSQLLVGTQMLAKGHDFPNVTLVVMLDVDHGFYGTDFRAAERMSQMIVQVAGRAGRGDKPGRVLVQTRHPDHPLLHELINSGYEAYINQALIERQQAKFPPFGFQALIRAEATRSSLPETFLQEAKKLAGSMNDCAIEFWGPVAATMQRKKGQHRFHLLLQTENRASLHRFLQYWLPEISALASAKKVRWSVDIDPQDFYA